MVTGTYGKRKHSSLKNGFPLQFNNLAKCDISEIHSNDHRNLLQEESEEIPLHAAVMTFISYFFLILFGYLRDFMRRYGLEKSKAFKEAGNNKVGN